MNLCLGPKQGSGDEPEPHSQSFILKAFFVLLAVKEMCLLPWSKVWQSWSYAVTLNLSFSLKCERDDNPESHKNDDNPEFHSQGSIKCENSTWPIAYSTDKYVT